MEVVESPLSGGLKEITYVTVKYLALCREGLNKLKSGFFFLLRDFLKIATKLFHLPKEPHIIYRKKKKKKKE